MSVIDLSMSETEEKEENETCFWFFQKMEIYYFWSNLNFDAFELSHNYFFASIFKECFSVNINIS